MLYFLIMVINLFCCYLALTCIKSAPACRSERLFLVEVRDLSMLGKKGSTIAAPVMFLVNIL